MSAPNSVPGHFIVIEGGDGAGKGSVIAHLAATLRGAGQNPLVSREPGGTPEGLALRSLLLSDAGAVWDPLAELLLMAAARVQHVRQVITPARAAGRTVLCDRFVASTLAYQGGGRGIDPGLILRLHAATVDGIQPDLTILLDVDPVIGLARSRARLRADPAADEGRFEALDLAFHVRVRDTYRRLAAEQPGWVVIDAGQPLHDVAAAAARALPGYSGGSASQPRSPRIAP